MQGSRQGSRPPGWRYPTETTHRGSAADEDFPVGRARVVVGVIKLTQNLADAWWHPASMRQKLRENEGTTRASSLSGCSSTQRHTSRSMTRHRQLVLRQRTTLPASGNPWPQKISSNPSTGISPVRSYRSLWQIYSISSAFQLALHPSGSMVII